MRTGRRGATNGRDNFVATGRMSCRFVTIGRAGPRVRYAPDMSGELVRFGIAMEPDLLAQLDALAAGRGCTRSELLRDLVRHEVTRSAAADAVPAVASVTLVYNHHVRLLSERLTAIQHDLGRQVQATMHVHLDHDNCMEVIVLRGRSDALRTAAERMLGTRGVTHGGMEIVTEGSIAGSRTHRHTHHADHTHPHHDAPAKRPAKRKTLAKKTRTKT